MTPKLSNQGVFLLCVYAGAHARGGEGGCGKGCGGGSGGGVEGGSCIMNAMHMQQKHRRAHPIRVGKRVSD